MNIEEVVVIVSGGGILCISLLNALARYIAVLNSDVVVSVISVVFMLLVAVLNIKAQHKRKIK
jgi:hypothetical protein